MAEDPLKELWALPLSSDEKRQLSVKLGLLKLEGKDPSVFFHAPDAEEKAGVLRGFLKESAPRIEDEDSMDLTFRTVNEFSTPFVPRLEDLSAFLLKKPEGLHIRISPRTYKMVRDYDVQGLFSPSNGDRCHVLEAHLIACILPAPDTGVTEFSFIQVWDNLINTPIKLFLPVPFSKDRNTNFNTATDSFLPDLVGYVGAHWSLWIAEETAEQTGYPLEELVSKRKWCYKTIPYILGYFARGLTVTLVALCPEHGSMRSCELATFNLHDIAQRMQLFMVTFNVGRVLAGLHEVCSRENEGTEFEIVKVIGSGKSVRLAGDQVIKGYPTKQKRKHVWTIYSQLKGCPNMETCLSRKPNEEAQENKRRKVTEFTLRFAPRLSRTARATTQESLVKALLDVTRALTWLKQNKWIHRDVDWRNLALNETTQVWTLIDADEACKLEQATTAHPLCETVHAPEMLTGGHGFAVDVWGLGYLIKSARNVTILNADVQALLAELCDSCLVSDPSNRPNISECRLRLVECQKLITNN